jgi:predicted AlkP superfamily pyrophosphatase or phosphodiesterase
VTTMQYPDYENGLVNLSNSILRGFGAECRHKTLPDMDVKLEKGFQNVVMMLFDGMGMDALERHLPEDSFLRRHLVKPISSVFPPTTTAVLTSIESGLTPYEHGWLGWSLYFKEIDQIVELFPNTVKDGHGAQAADFHVARKWIPVERVGSAIERAGIGKMITVSPYDGYRITRFEELFDAVRRFCGEPGKKYIYAYWNQPDAVMHETGCYSERTAEAIRGIDNSVEALCGALTDTLVIVTADHGHIDVRYRFVSDHPALMDMLIRPVSVESRAAAFYVKDAYKRQFPDAFREAFGADFLLLSQAEVVESGLFGNGVMHPRFLESVGDYLAVAVADYAIVYNHESKLFAATHAGLTKQEMDVPLIMVEKPAI